MARLDICLASKIINNELFYDVTKDGFFSITLPEKNVKCCSNCIYFENICFYINNRAKLPNSSYTIYNAYNTTNNNIEDNTLTIKQLVLLLKNTNPNKNYNNMSELNTSSFIVNIK
jgi:hypothetical protein